MAGDGRRVGIMGTRALTSVAGKGGVMRSGCEVVSSRRVGLSSGKRAAHSKHASNQLGTAAGTPLLALRSGWAALAGAFIMPASILKTKASGTTAVPVPRPGTSHAVMPDLSGSQDHPVRAPMMSHRNLGATHA